jgi:hypothetical protein
MKYITLLIISFLFFPIINFAQCNIAKLLERKVEKYASAREKSVGIRIIARVNYSTLIELQNFGDNTFKYIGDCFKKGVKPDIKFAIDKVGKYRKEIENRTQLLETNYIDELTYCFLLFQRNVYHSINNIFITSADAKEAKKRFSEYAKTQGDMGAKEQGYIKDIEREHKRIEAAYPISIKIKGSQ